MPFREVTIVLTYIVIVNYFSGIDIKEKISSWHFLNLNMPTNHQGIWVKCRFPFSWAGWGPSLCIFSKLPGDTEAAGPRIVL